MNIIAQRFSKPFYNSAQWSTTREYILKRDNYLCVQCDKPAEEIHHVIWLTPKNIMDSNITINADNLISLCKDCHFKAHKDQRAKAHTGDVQHEVGGGYTFDRDGQLTRTQHIYLITGSPGSGKTTYALQHIKEKDIIIDVDMILTAITGIRSKEKPYELLGIALEIRDLMYRIVRDYKGEWINAYVVATLPMGEDRARVSKELHASLIEIDTDKDECIKRALHDTERINKERQLLMIQEYWKAYTPL